MIPYPSSTPSTLPTISAPVDTTGMIVGGVAVGALSIASAFTLFQFMRRGSGSGSASDPASSSKSTLITEPEPEAMSESGSESVVQLESVQESDVRSETLIELETRVGLSERPSERPPERPSVDPSVGPSVNPSVNLPAEPVRAEPMSVTSETSNPLIYLSIDPAHVDEITQFLAAMKKRTPPQ